MNSMSIGQRKRVKKLKKKEVEYCQLKKSKINFKRFILSKKMHGCTLHVMHESIYNQIYMKKKIKQVEKYFSKVAINYDKKSNSFPWDILRNYEKKKILSFIKYNKYEQILELGSGAGYYTNIFLRFAKKIYAVDLSLSMLDKIKSLKVSKN